MMSSSQNRDIFVRSMVSHARVSSAKSRDATASIEFTRILSNPSRSAVKGRSSGYPVDARAADPSGEQFTRRKASNNRSKSRENICS